MNESPVPRSVSLRPFERVPDELGNVAFSYFDPIWSATDPTDIELRLALSMLAKAENLSLWIDDKPQTFVSGRAK